MTIKPTPTETPKKVTTQTPQKTSITLLLRTHLGRYVESLFKLVYGNPIFSLTAKAV